MPCRLEFPDRALWAARLWASKARNRIIQCRLDTAALGRVASNTLTRNSLKRTLLTAPRLLPPNCGPFIHRLTRAAFLQREVPAHIPLSPKRHDLFALCVRKGSINLLLEYLALSPFKQTMGLEIRLYVSNAARCCLDVRLVLVRIVSRIVVPTRLTSASALTWPSRSHPMCMLSLPLT